MELENKTPPSSTQSQPSFPAAPERGEARESGRDGSEPRPEGLPREYRQSEPPRRNFLTYAKWGSLVIGSLVVGLFLLMLIGRFFIQEVVEEVVVEDTARPSTVLVVGDKAPHWELKDLEGREIALTDYLGTPLVLTFWTSWNERSFDQIKIFDDYGIKNREPLFAIVTINSQEDKSIVTNFIDRGGYGVMVVLDETGEVGEEYKIRNLPITYFVDEKGIIGDIFVGALSEAMFVERATRLLSDGAL